MSVSYNPVTGEVTVSAGGESGGGGGPVAISDVTGLTDTLQGKNDVTGFPVDSTGAYLTTLSWDELTRTVTITPTGASFDIFVDGVIHTFTGPQSIVIGSTQGNHFVYFDQTGTLVTGTTPWNILLHAMAAFIFWDTTNSKGICFDERHHAGRDLYWHRNQHLAEGTKIISGFEAAGYTLNNGATDGAVTYSIASGVVADEDIQITTDARPDGGPYTVLHRAGAAGDWQIVRSLTRPFLDSGTALQYNQFTGATWQRTVMTEDRYVNYWVFAVTSINAECQIIIVPGQTIHTTTALAYAETISTLSWGNIPFQEIAPLYQVTLFYNAAGGGSFANTAKCSITRINRIIGSSVSITQAVQVDHGSLSGLSDDDHPQYALAPGAVTAGSVATFADSTGRALAQAPYKSPYILAQSAVPVCLAPNGTVATNGIVTLGTALPTTYSGGIWLRLPAGAVVGGLAGLYWAVMSSTTAGQVHTTFADPASQFIPYIPTGLVAAVGSDAAYTQTTAIVTLVNVTVPGGSMGLNGGFRINQNQHGSGAGSKAFRNYFGGSLIWNPQSVISNATGGTLIVRNRGVVNKQCNLNSSTGDVTTSAGAVSYGTVDTSVNQFIGLTAQLVGATDAATVEAFTIEILPS